MEQIFSLFAKFLTIYLSYDRLYSLMLQGYLNALFKHKYVDANTNILLNVAIIYFLGTDRLKIKKNRNFNN